MLKTIGSKLVAIIIYQLLTLVLSSDPLLIETNSGSIQCTTESIYPNNNTYCRACKGIPYAEPPVGPLRFKGPVPKKPWSGILQANQYRNCCIAMVQASFNPAKTAQDEDCLFLNVFMPAMDKCSIYSKLAVFFFIHGGAYSVGDGTNYSNGQDLLMDSCIIVVTINYRLGPFGGANFNLPGLTGNMGLKDVRCGLQWVHDNIEYFGGDPNSITVVGQSSGGCFAHLLALDCDARKNIKRIVPMSGSAFNPFAYVRVDQMDILRQTFQLSNDTSDEDVYNYMLNLNATVIAEKVPVFQDYTIFPFLLIWALSFENKTIAIDPILTNPPKEMYEYDTCTVPISYVDGLFGDTSAETLLFTNPYDPYSPIRSLNSNFDVGLPFNGLTLSPNSDLYKKIQQDICKFYFGTTPPIDETLDNMNRFNQMTSDINFCYPNFVAMKTHSIHSTTFCYWNNVSSSLNLGKINNNLTQYYGTMHGEDLFYLFVEYQYIDYYEKAKSDPTVVNIMHFEPNFYANFATTGQANGVKPINECNECVYITNNGLDKISGPETDAMKFWTNIYEQVKPYIKNGF